jgi:hypothetical protein
MAGKSRIVNTPQAASIYKRLDHSDAIKPSFNPKVGDREMWEWSTICLLPSNIVEDTEGDFLMDRFSIV